MSKTEIEYFVERISEIYSNERLSAESEITKLKTEMMHL